MKCLMHLVGVIIVLQYFCGICTTQLLINWKNQGGEILLETITSNVTEDVITLEFRRSDGTLVSQLIDFRNEVQIISVVVLGEEERGQNLYQVLCFVNHFYKMDFISSDAMAKLRQKNPGTVRIAEEDRGYMNYTMDLFIDITKSSIISKHVAIFCGEAPETTFTRNEDLKQWIQRPGTSESLLMAAVHNFTLSSVIRHGENTTRSSTGTNSTTTTTTTTTISTSGGTSVTKCADTSNLWASCSCSLELCIGWYPCGLKFCKGRNDGKKMPSTYRCGIKTCKKSYLFSYYSKMKQNCLWDE